VYDKFNRLIHFLATRRPLPPGVSSEDIVQSVWLRLIESGFDENASGAKSYIRETVKSVIADAAGPPTRNSTHYAEGTHPLWFLDRPAEEAEEIDTDRLDRTLRALTEPDRILLQRRYLEGVSIRVLAKNARIRIETMRTRLRDAKRRARRAYDKVYETGDAGD
jgi:RNA polymerase sigma factor (sigma-70 family)